MRIRATLRIRNDEMIAARERLGLSQLETAKQAGVTGEFLMRCEKLDYAAIPRKTLQDNGVKLAVFLGLTPEIVIPEELQNESIQSCYTTSTEIDTKTLLEGMKQFQSRNLLPAPDEECERSELIETIEKFLPTLSFQEREIIRLVYGLTDEGKEYNQYDAMEIGRILGISHQRVRQVKAKALRKLQTRFENLK